MSDNDIAKTALAPRYTGDSGASRGNALPVGTRLREFEIIKVVGEGGFGIVYLAQDHTLGREVAIKEFMPSSLAVRDAHLGVTVRHGNRETFELGLRSFVNEARLLARFDLPNVVRVYQFWEDHGTAYIVMPFYRGSLVADWISAKSNREPLPCDDEVWFFRQFLSPVLAALDALHAAQCYHRDLAPDNILLTEDSLKPVLLDFGAARHVIGSATQKLTAFVKPGYAPIEQYGDVGDILARQGPWTDIYGLAAVLYHLISGMAPPAAPTRLLRDPMQPLATLARGRYTDQLLSAIDAGLAIRPEHRPQSIALWRALIGGTEGEGTPAVAGRLTLVDYENPTPLDPDAAASDARPDLPVSGAGAAGLPGHRSPATVAMAAHKPERPAAPRGALPVAASRVLDRGTATPASPHSSGATDLSKTGANSRFSTPASVPSSSTLGSLYDAPVTTQLNRLLRSSGAPSALPAVASPAETAARRDESQALDQHALSVGTGRRRGLSATLGWTPLVGVFLLASALWISTDAWLPARPAAPAALASAASPAAQAPAQLATDAVAPAPIGGVMTPERAETTCDDLVRRTAQNATPTDEELHRYEKDCVR